MTAIASREDSEWASGLTRRDKLALLDSMDWQGLRAICRDMLTYAPGQMDRAITERLAVRAATAARRGRLEQATAEYYGRPA